MTTQTLETNNGNSTTTLTPTLTPQFALRPSPLDLLRRDDGSVRPGELYLANESRFNSAFFSEPLTTYATGWRDPHKIETLLDFISPPIQTPRRFEFKRTDNSEAFLSELDDARAISSDFKRVEYKSDSMVEKTLNRGLTMRIDLDSVEEIPHWRETYVNRLLQRLLRNELRRAINVSRGRRARRRRCGIRPRAKIRIRTFSAR